VQTDLVTPAPAIARGRKPLAVFWVGVIAVLTAVILGAAAWLLIYEPPKATVRLPSGAVWTLEAVTYGRNHTWDRRRWWERLLPAKPPPTPRAAARALPFTQSFNTAKDATVLWLTTRMPRRGTVYAQMAVTDEHGCRLERPMSFQFWGRMNPGRTEGAMAVITTALPRTGEASLQFLDLAGRPQGRLAIPKRKRSASPVWTPRPLPITRKSGPLTVVMEELTPRTRLEGYNAVAAYRTLWKGKSANAWMPVGITVSDALGNSVETSRWRKEPRHHVSFNGLCREEPWKITMELAPRTGAEIAPQTTRTVEKAPFPSYRSIPPPSGSKRDGITIQLSNAVRTPSRGRGFNAASGWLRVRSGPGLHISLLYAADQRGRPITITSTFRSVSRLAPRGGSPETLYMANWRGAVDATDLSATFAIHRTRTVEFLAQPGEPTP
jgi:hypothetical protein